MFPQITTLINHKDKPKKSERTLAAIHRVGQAVSVAVGRFVAVGEAIATENQELKDEMGQACFEARRAGSLLLWHFTDLLHLDLTHLFHGHKFMLTIQGFFIFKTSWWWILHLNVVSMTVAI